MPLDSPLANHKRFGDRTIRRTLGDQCCNLTLALAESIKARRGLRRTWRKFECVRDCLFYCERLASTPELGVDRRRQLRAVSWYGG
jgi:hypothetical protein